MGVKTKFDFDINFQRQILSLIVNSSPFANLVLGTEIIDASNFDTEYLSWLFAHLSFLLRKYGNMPSQDVIIREIEKSTELNADTKKDIKELVEESTSALKNESYLTDEVSSFIKHQKIKAALQKSVSLLKEGKYEEIVSEINRSYNALDTSTDSVNEIYYFTDFQRRLEERLDDEISRGIPTNIPELDHYFAGGGICKGELACCLAPSNRGKSQWLVKVGKAALVHRKKVLHISMEMSHRRVSERYDQNFLGLTKEELFTVEGTKALETFMTTQALYYTKGLKREGLIIKFWPPKGVTVNDIKNYILRKRIHGHKFDLICIDYGDVIKPDVIYKNNYIELGNIFYDLANLAAELDVAVWTASQAGRQAYRKKIISLDDFAESMKKVHPCHVIVALCQTPEEAKKSEMRIFIAKNREGEKEVEVRVKTNFAVSTMQAIMDLPDEGGDTSDEDDDEDVEVADD